MNANDVLNSFWKLKIEHVNIFDEDFLVSKDEALQPINIFFENEDKEDLNNNQIKNKHLSLKIIKENDEEKRSARSKKSKRSQKSQKSTSNTNKKSERKKSIRNSQLYNSNIIIVNDEDDEDRSPTDPIEKEVEKIKKLMARSNKKKKKKNKKSSKSHTKQ